MDIKYPLAKETINDEDINALCDWLKGYPRLTKGQLTWDVEADWAKYIGTDYAAFNNSGSSANLLMVAAAVQCGRIANKKIVVPSVGWVTTISPAIQLGLTPIMCGADADTFGMDLDQLEAICERERPDAVIFVQVLGVPHHKERILELKAKYGFTLLEDSVGDMSTFSFYFGHQLSTIEGGMVNTDDHELYEMLLMLRSHGWAKDLSAESSKALMDEHGIDDFHSPFTFFIPGYNLRSTDLQAFLGIRQRHKNHCLYAEKLEGTVEFQRWGDNVPVSISFGALAESTEHRKEIVTRLVENGVETRIFSAGNLGRHPFWTDLYEEFRDEVSDKIHARGFFLPNYPELTEEEIEIICNIVKGE